MVDPMQMKALAVRQAIKDLKTDDRKQRIKALKALGVVLTVSEDPNSEKQVLKALQSALKDEDEAVRKAAKTALEDRKVQEKDMHYLLELSRKAQQQSEISANMQEVIKILGHKDEPINIFNKAKGKKFIDILLLSLLFFLFMIMVILIIGRQV